MDNALNALNDTAVTQPVADSDSLPEQGKVSPVADERDRINFIWDVGEHPGVQTEKLCQLLAETGEIFRAQDGCIMLLKPGEPPRVIDDAVKLEGFIRGKLSVKVIHNGKMKGCSIPAKDLTIFLKTPSLQELLPVVDLITDVVTYGEDWEITKPGYNDGGEGGRYFYTGDPINPAKEPKCIREFLSALCFKDKRADAANTVALALTVLLRHKFQGCKPFAAVMANRSHAGKDTVLDFSAGRTRHVEISWGKADWAVQNEAVAALVDPCVGFITLGNIRAGNGIIESAFIERIVTSPDAVMQSSKRRGDGFHRKGDFVVGCSANQGRFSTDLMNRSLPIALELNGDLEKRNQPLGDLRHEYLPAHRDEIEAELCGMIEKWKAEGNPLDEKVSHPMKEWARTIGGILKANGFEGFLSNWSLERSVQDRTTEALGILAHAIQPVQEEQGEKGWLRINQIADVALKEGVVEDLIGSKQGMNAAAIHRKLGIVLSGQKGNTVVFANDDGEFDQYKIDRMRRRVNGANPATCYKFDPVKISDSVQEGGDDNER
jgi:hypothetical protein